MPLISRARTGLDPRAPVQVAQMFPRLRADDVIGCPCKGSKITGGMMGWDYGGGFFGAPPGKTDPSQWSDLALVTGKVKTLAAPKTQGMATSFLGIWDRATNGVDATCIERDDELSPEARLARDNKRRDRACQGVDLTHAERMERAGPAGLGGMSGKKKGKGLNPLVLSALIVGAALLIRR
jgi:hypothetical protein